MAAGVETGSTRDLWQFIAASSVLRPKELVGQELTNNKTRLAKGLLLYKKQVQPAGEALKTLKVKGTQLEFVTKLSKFLILDETVTYNLFCSYLLHCYRGCQQNIKSVLTDDRQSQATTLSIRDYYFSERLYIIRCLKQILSYAQDPNHPYQKEYEAFFDSANTDNELINNIVIQYDQVCHTPCPTWQTHGALMNERQQLIWVRQNLKEQCELLELILLYYKDFELSSERLATLAEQFKKQAFGHHQSYRHLLDDGAETLIQRISYYQTLILIEGTDIEFLYRCYESGNLDEHHIVKDEKNFRKLDTTLCSLGDSVAHGAVTMLWAVVRHITMEPADSVVMATKRLCNVALQLRFLDYLDTMFTSEPFNGKTAVAVVARSVVNGFLGVMLNTFNIDVIMDVGTLYEVATKLLTEQSVAEEFLDKGTQDGLSLLLHSSIAQFPIDFHPLLKLSTALVQAGPISCKKVTALLQQLPSYLEFLDENSSHDVMQTQHDAVWKLIREKRPYASDTFVIPNGTFGELHHIPDKPPLIKWEGQFNGWDLFHGEIHRLLSQITCGADAVVTETMLRVVAIVRLLSRVLREDTRLIEFHMPMMEKIFSLVQRFSVVSSPPLELLSACLDVIGCLIKSQHSANMWHLMRQTGLLPYITENLDNLTEAASGSSLHAGNFGLILAGYECTSATYRVTESFLDAISGLLQLFTKVNKSYELMACTLFVLREIFPMFRKWRYTDVRQRERLGQKCLEIFHKVLDISHDANLKDAKEPSGGQHKVTLRQATVYVLLYTEAGRTLLDIVGMGAEVVEHAFVQQGSAEEGLGVDLIHLIRLAFSVLNRLLLLRPPDQPVSPVESALSAQPANHAHRHVVATIAQYIYHRHDPRLPTLATLLLKRLSMISPMSILACLGNEAQAVRDTYLARLQAYSEDIRLKVVILEFLAVTVDTQPGLIEVFLNVVQADDKNKNLSIGQISCLQSTLDLIAESKQGGHLCPPSLLNSALEFVHALWRGHRETAMAVLREKDTFWKCVMACLNRDLPATYDEKDQSSLSYEIRARAHVFKILALEILRVPANKLDKSFKTAVKMLISKQRIEALSKFIRQIVEHEGAVEVQQDEFVLENSVLHLLIGWKQLIISLATHPNDLFSLSAKVKEQIMGDLLDGIQAQFQSSTNMLQVKLSAIASEFYFTLLKYWKSHVTSWSERLNQLAHILRLTCSNSETLIPSVQIGMLGALTISVQHVQKEKVQGLGGDLMTRIFPIACSVLQQSTRQLALPREGAGDREETSLSQTNVKLKLQVACTSLVEELIVAIDSPLLWLPVVQQHSVLQTLLSSVELWIEARKGVHYVQSMFLLFITMSRSPEAAEALRVCGLTQHVCLALMSIQRPEDLSENCGVPGSNGRSSSSSASLFSSNQTWPSVYRSAIQLYTSMLATLRYNFLEDALNFVGVHQERMLMCLEQVKSVLSYSAMLETEQTCAFIVELSNYRREWRLHLPDVLSHLMLSVSQLLQTSVATLIRPRLLDHILERHSRGDPSQSQQPVALVRAVSRSLQNQVSTDSIDQPSEHLLAAQHRLLTITALCLTTLRRFSPDLCGILLDQSMDISEYDLLLEINFSTPALDTEGLPSFGTVLSCANLCLKHMAKLTTASQSPLKWSKVTDADSLNRPLLLFTLETCLHLAMCQAVRYIKEPTYQGREKQLLKRELGAELNQFLNSLLRYLRKGGPPSPGPSTSQPSPQTSTTHVTLSRSTSQTSFSNSQEQAFFKLVHNFVKQVLR